MTVRKTAVHGARFFLLLSLTASVFFSSQMQCNIDRKTTANTKNTAMKREEKKRNSNSITNKRIELNQTLSECSTNALYINIQPSGWK